MESSSSAAPLPRSYADGDVLLLEPLRDPFLARELEQRRLSKMQEVGWIAGIAKDIQSDERANAVAKRWLRAVSLSEKRDFVNYDPLLNDEAFQLFVQFFWLIKGNHRPRADKLVNKARRKLGLEAWFFESTVNTYLESAGDPTFSTPAWEYWLNNPSGEAHGLMPRKARTMSRKTTKIVKRKRSVNRSFSSAITKRPAAAQLSFKKRGLGAKARPGKRATVNKDPDYVEDVASDLGSVPRFSKRKRGHNDPKALRPHKGIRPDGGKRRKVETNNLLRHSAAQQNEREDAAECVLTTDLPGHTRRKKRASSLPKAQHSAGVSHVATYSGGATERAPKRPKNTKNSTRKQRPSPSALSSPSADQLQYPANITGCQPIVELDSFLANIGAGGYSAPPFAFDNVAAEVAEDEDDFYDCPLTEYPEFSTIESKRERRAPVRPRPPLPIMPPIWAQSRQEVCESLDFFRSFQGGVYHSNDVVKGYLLGGHSSSRDLFHHGGKLIISHGGGKSEALHMKNRRLEIQGPGDQLEDDRSVRALLTNYRSRRPLVLLADNNYALFPFDLDANGYTYVVLGLYWITHAWAELQQVDENHSVVRYKFAFQWCEGQGDPWWLQGTEGVPVVTQTPNSQLRDGEPGVSTTEEQHNSTLTDSHQASQPQGTTHFCRRCRSSSSLVYQDAPMCLQPCCAAFCRIDQATLDTSRTQTLSYSTELLRLRPAIHQPVSADSLYPPLPTKDTTSRPFAKGMHCRDCGRLSTRFKWEHYECNHCHRVYEAPRFVFSHKDFWLQEQALKFHHHRVAEDSGIVIRALEFRSRATRNSSALPYVQTFDLPHNRGHVHLIPGHPSINTEANALFRDYQRQAACGEIQFRRWPLRAHKCRGQLLSNYFSQNTGAPYQYVGGAERTTPLEDGAKAVLGALALIKYRIATALGKDVPFNEILSAAYMEKQRMAFHSDSERGLGPVVASLSLGSVAEMHFRLHSKYMDTEGPRRAAMSILLRHGDVLVMEGAGVQEYYEHTVIPKNFRVVATARFISPENYTTGTQPSLSIDQQQ